MESSGIVFLLIVANRAIDQVREADRLTDARVEHELETRRVPQSQTTTHLATQVSGYLRGEVGRRLALRHAPRLEFVFDSSIGEAIRLTYLIDRAVRDDQQKDDPA